MQRVDGRLRYHQTALLAPGCQGVQCLAYSDIVAPELPVQRGLGSPQVLAKKRERLEAEMHDIRLEEVE